MKKYEKVFQADYEEWYKENQQYRERVSHDPDRLSYHLMPETGWLNDPNGLCQFHGVYHIYYQFTPFEPTGELKMWGHYTTKDFIHYTNEKPALFPDEDFDAHGVYSGSAFLENDTIHYFYTGNVKYFDRADYDYILNGRGSNVVHVMSQDGFHFSSKELQMTLADYPKDMSAHVRDPKILKRDDGYYMVLGARDKNSRGLVLLYHSDDLQHWEYKNRIMTKEPFGYMWECPDLFELDGQLLLICCPQGVEQRGIDFENVHQCTVMRLEYDFKKNTYEIDEISQIHSVDRGCDFYAPQTFEDEKGRRILIGWMGIPDASYTNPTVEAGWQHALTMPRELHFKNGRLYQTPLKEWEDLRLDKTEYDDLEALNEAGKTDCVYEAKICFDHCKGMILTLREGVELRYQEGLLTLDLGEHGSKRTPRSVKIDELKNVWIFSDTSSIEIFVNDGVEVFTTRVYGQKGKFAIKQLDRKRCSGKACYCRLGAFQISI